jgi:hypothetical protein
MTSDSTDGRPPGGALIHGRIGTTLRERGGRFTGTVHQGTVRGIDPCRLDVRAGVCGRGARLGIRAAAIKTRGVACVRPDAADPVTRDLGRGLTLAEKKRAADLTGTALRIHHAGLCWTHKKRT